MRNRERDALVGYRLRQAAHALRQARLLAGAAEWEGVVNRAYYAMFYAALALLLTKGLGSSKHAGVLALVDREFVKSGLLSKELGRSLRDAFNQRQKSDYGEFSSTSPARARELLKRAARFVRIVKEMGLARRRPK